MSASESRLPVETFGGQNTFNNDDTWEQGERRRKNPNTFFFFYLITVDKCATIAKGGEKNVKYKRWVIRNCGSFQYTAIVTSKAATLIEVCGDVSSNVLLISCKLKVSSCSCLG